MWLPCPTCHHNKVKDTAVTVDNGKANMFHHLNVRKLESSADVWASGLFLATHNDVPVISFAHCEGLKGLMTECGNKVFISSWIAHYLNALRESIRVSVNFINTDHVPLVVEVLCRIIIRIF